MQESPRFYVGDVPVHGDVMLAPMAGYADVPHRALCRSFGSAMSYTEFVAVEDVINENPNVRRLLEFSDQDRPMAIQLFGNDARFTTWSATGALAVDLAPSFMGKFWPEG